MYMKSGSMMMQLAMNMNSTEPMHMTFYAGYNATILFACWHTTSWQEMFGSCVAMLAMAVVYEGLKAARQSLKKRAIQHKRNHQEDSGRETPLDDVPIILRTPAFITGRRLYFLHHLVQTLLHFLQFMLGYTLMLIAMTFNVWLFISVVFGGALGYFLFNYRQSLNVDVMEDPCH